MDAVKIIRDANWRFDMGDVTIEQYEELLAPLRDVEVVRHGRWIHRTPNNGHTPPYDECDQCGWEVRIGLNFCPKCGAKMDGKDSGNE